MRAMVLHATAPIEQAPLRLEEIPLPTPRRATDVRVRVRACGVCHTDLHIVEGDLPLPHLPLVPGHQVVGTIDAAGEGVTGLKEGDRVGVPWLHCTCGKCQYCREHNENLCDDARFTGLHCDGGYADALVVPAVSAYPLPPTFSDLQAAPLLCAGVIGYRAFRLAGVVMEDRIGLYGFGGSAHIVLQFARHLGCEVCVFTRSAAHQELARKLGAHWVGTAADTPPGPLDAAIIFAPAGELVPHALRATRKGATVALAGITMSDIPALPYDLIYHERVLRSVANSTRQDVREFLHLAAEVPIQTEIETYPLADANRALADVKHSRLPAAAVLTME